MPGARRTHSLACESKKARRVSHHRYNAFNRHSLRDGFNAYFVLSPVTGLFCHRRFAEKVPAKLDASVGASGPHDFAVRALLQAKASGGLSAEALAKAESTRSSRALSRPPHPAPNVRDDRDTPLSRGRDGGSRKFDLPDGESEIFFARGLDNPNHVESLEQIAVLAHAVSEASGPPNQATSSAIELILPVEANHCRSLAALDRLRERLSSQSFSMSLATGSPGKLSRIVR
jgi:hypothetical protein